MTPRDNELLAELLLRWEELHEQGQDMPASQLAKAHPQLIEELTYRIQALKGISWIDDPLEDDPPDDLPDDPPHAPRTLAGRYRLDELIAEGGFAKPPVPPPGGARHTRGPDEHSPLFSR